MAFWAVRGVNVLHPISPRFIPSLGFNLHCIGFSTPAARRLSSEFFHSSGRAFGGGKKAIRKGLCTLDSNFRTAELILTGTFVSPAEPPGRVVTTTNNPATFFLFLTKVLPLACDSGR